MSKVEMRMRTHEITNSEDVIDSRDVIERIKYLDGSEDADEQAERKALLALGEEASGYAEDWTYGVEFKQDYTAVDFDGVTYWVR